MIEWLLFNISRLINNITKSPAVNQKEKTCRIYQIHLIFRLSASSSHFQAMSYLYCRTADKNVRLRNCFLFCFAVTYVQLVSSAFFLSLLLSFVFASSSHVRARAIWVNELCLRRLARVGRAESVMCEPCRIQTLTSNLFWFWSLFPIKGSHQNTTSLSIKRTRNKYSTLILSVISSCYTGSYYIIIFVVKWKLKLQPSALNFHKNQMFKINDKL